LLLFDEFKFNDDFCEDEGVIFETMEDLEEVIEGNDKMMKKKKMKIVMIVFEV
jgi:hypothetical protein